MGVPKSQLKNKPSREDKTNGERRNTRDENRAGHGGHRVGDAGRGASWPRADGCRGRVSFNVLQGDRFVVVGPSGCGKSTLLKAVGGYLTPTEGEIRLKGERIAKPGPDRIMVFQEFDQLLPWMTVFENVTFPLKTTGTLRGKAADARAMHYLDKVKLTDFAHSYPHTLSGA